MKRFLIFIISFVLLSTQHSLLSTAHAAASYPSSVKAFTRLIDRVSPIRVTQINELYDEVEAIESTLKNGPLSLKGLAMLAGGGEGGQISINDKDDVYAFILDSAATATEVRLFTLNPADTTFAITNAASGKVMNVDIDGGLSAAAHRFIIDSAGNTTIGGMTAPSDSRYVYFQDVDSYIKLTGAKAMTIAAYGSLTLTADSAGSANSLIISSTGETTLPGSALFVTPGTYFNDVKVRLNTSDSSDTGCLWLSGGGGSAETSRGSSIFLFGNEHTTLPGKIILQPGSGGKINLSTLPASSAGLATGDLWNDSGTVKIK